MGAARRQRLLRSRHRAFTLVELVIVVTIIGIVAAIAVPRMSSTSTHATANAVQATLMSVRTAIDCFYAEHNKYPGYDPANDAPDGVNFVKQLTLYSDAAGQTNGTRSTVYKYGPYLRSPFPVNPANNLATVQVKRLRTDPDPADGSVGWVAVLADGDFGVSATDAQLDRIGLVEPLGKASVRTQPQ
ncbi:MAG: prepilin-type N-terminal cleavage/methylation domain-containing protein [Planctomycetota bacterium]